MKKVHTQKGSKLWDSIHRSCEEITKLKGDIEVFKNSVSRILVISCGKDEGSQYKVEDIVKDLITNKIVVDSIIFGDENAILFDDPDHSYEEERFLIIGMTGGKGLCIVSHCYKDEDSTIRIISAREATKSEKKTYQKGW